VDSKSIIKNIATTKTINTTDKQPTDSMTFFTQIILQGKIYKVDLRKERYVNYIVLSGFILLLTWMLFLYPNVFIDIRMVLLLLFLPGLLLTPILYKKILRISGYRFFIKNNLKYNLAMPFLAYMLITIPVGNGIVASFLSGNYLFAQPDTKTVTADPFNLSESHSGKTHSSYSHLDVDYDGVVKQINFGEIPLDTLANKSLSITVSKGLFGYYIIRGYTLSTKQSW
jgi:hypothetical protein